MRRIRRIEAAARRAWGKWSALWAGCVCVLAAVAAVELAWPMVQLDADMAAAGAARGYGIVDLEFAFTNAEAGWILAAWGEEGVRAARLSLDWDAWFIPAYGLFVVAALAWLARCLPVADRPRRERFAWVLTLCVPVACLFDCVENAALGVGVADGFESAFPYALLASVSATAKFAILVACGTYIACWVLWKVESRAAGRVLARWVRSNPVVRRIGLVGLPILIAGTLAGCVATGDGGARFGFTLALLVGVLAPIAFTAVPRIEWREAEEPEGTESEDAEPEDTEPERVDFDYELPESSLLDMVWIPGWILRSDDESSPLHNTEVKAFLISRHEVTRGDWSEMGLAEPANGFYPNGDRPKHPANNVNWFDALQFCNALSQREGLRPAYYRDEALGQVWQHREAHGDAVHWDPDANGYRLPTEAEWEFAARADADPPTRFFWGNGAERASEFAWFGKNSGGEPRAVDQKARNDFGLSDMVGNVWEWCWDLYGRSNRAYGRVLRGGTFSVGVVALASSSRGREWPDVRERFIGFRCVRSAHPRHGLNR